MSQKDEVKLQMQNYFDLLWAKALAKNTGFIIIDSISVLDNDDMTGIPSVKVNTFSSTYKYKFCFTGTSKLYTRKQLTEMTEKAGAYVDNTCTINTDILVVFDKPGITKVKKAAKSYVTIIDGEAFLIRLTTGVWPVGGTYQVGSLRLTKLLKSVGLDAKLKPIESNAANKKPTTKVAKIAEKPADKTPAAKPKKHNPDELELESRIW